MKGMGPVRAERRPFGGTRRLVITALAIGMIGAALGLSVASATPGRSSSKAVHMAAFEVFLNAHGVANAAGFRTAIKQDGNATVTLFASNGDAAKQFSQCQDAITSGQYNAFLIVAVDGPGMIPCAKNAIKHGITVLSLATPLGSNPNTVQPQVPGLAGVVLSPAGAAGRHQAQMVIQVCAHLNPCKVGYMFGLRALSFDAYRFAAFQGALKSHPNIKIVAQTEGSFLPTTGFAAAKDMLTAHPDLNVVAAAADPGARGAVTAATASHLKLQIIGDGGTKLAWLLIKAKKMYGSVIGLPYTEGRLGADIAIKTVRGEHVARRFINEADYSSVGPNLTQQNANRFKPEWLG